MHLTDFARRTLKDRYMIPSDVLPEDVFTRAVRAYTEGDFRERMQRYVEDQWFVPSTPVLANAGTTRGNPIACFLNRVPDSRAGITGHYTETSWLASNGGGVGGYWGFLRSLGQKTSSGSQSNGMIPFLGVIDRLVLAFAQGGTRRASYAGFLPISHPEIVNFIEMRKPTGGDINRKCLNLHHGVCISNQFMQCVDNNTDWALVDPHTKKVTSTINARVLWESILETRMLTGEPYIVFSDHLNDQRPSILKTLGVPVYSSNLCTEITVATQMPDNSEATGVCCLGSINGAKFDEFRDDPLFIQDCLRYLDNVLQAFIDGDSTGDDLAKRSAEYYRDVGLGLLGWHSLCQSKMYPLNSAMAFGLNHRVFKWLRTQADAANVALADERGPCPAAREAGEHKRFTHMLAVAPNASTSIFTNTSPGIEPYVANAYIRKTASGTTVEKNPYLVPVLKAHGLDTEEVWTDIAINNGSVQHLKQLDEYTRDVFKTAFEMGQLVLVEQAALRGPFIDQGQSLNLFFAPGTSREYYGKVHREAHRKGLKTLYYLRPLAAHKASTGKVVHEIVQDTSDMNAECLACAN